MKIFFSKISATLLTCIILLMVLSDSVGAQSPTATPTILPTSTLSSLPTPTPTLGVLQFENPDIATFSQLRQSEIELTGPYDSASFTFATPADWVLKEGIQLNLLLGVSFHAGEQAQGNVIVVGGGTLTILLNNQALLVEPLNEVGETEIKINIPLSSFTSTRSDGRMSMRFILESGSSCRIIGLDTSVYIHPTSYFNFPHDVARPSTSLVNFPRPILQNSFLPDYALLIIPDEPTAAELQSALTVSAGLGNMSSNRLIFDMITVSNLQEDLTKKNLIFIGKAGSLASLSQLSLPLPLANGEFQFSEGGTDDGVIEMVGSPWSASHVVLVVSGNTDAGVVKAAQAVSSGIIRPNRFENLAVIKQVNTQPVSGPQAVDQTLSSLGYEFQSFQQRRGEAREDYLFNIPAGMTVSTEAYFDIVYGHSSLMDYNTSQIVVLVNDRPVGSVRMSDVTAGVPTNHAKIMIPPTAILPGTINRLSIAVNLEPLTDCASTNSQGLWVNIWPESLIHLPLMVTPFGSLGSEDLGKYPIPFIYNSTLGDTAFVLERNSLESWRNAAQIAAFLGNQAGGFLTELSVFYGDAIPVTERAKYHLLVIGRPSQMPIIAEMNNDLPAPFLNNSDVVSDDGSFQVTYRITPDSPMGYVETMLSPWNSANIVLAILGNTMQGVNWAATSLVDPSLRGQLGGNFAVVNNKQIIPSNVRYMEASSEAIPTAEIPDAVTTQPSETMPDRSDGRPGWILPLLLTSVGLIVLIAVIAAVRNRSHINTRKKSVGLKGGNDGDSS